MKEIVISRRRLKKEISLLTVMFLIASGLNVLAIASYHTHWSELITELPVVLVITLVLYVFYAGLRIIFFLIRAGFR